MSTSRSFLDQHRASLRSGLLGYQVHYLARLLEHSLRRRIECHRVVPGQFSQLLVLYAEEPLTQRQLCDRVSVEQSTMARTLARMERDGLITRTADPTDGRRVQISLTPRSRGLRDDLLQTAQEVNDSAIGDIDSARIASLTNMVADLIRNMHARPDHANAATCRPDNLAREELP